MIRVGIVDDHAIVRAGIRLILDQSDGIEVVGEAGTEERAIVLARAHQPDVILLDVLMAGEGGIALVPGLLGVSPRSRILMLSSSADPGTVEKALDAGATGYSVKRATEAVMPYGSRVSLVLKADLRPGHSGELDGKVERLEHALEDE